MQQRDFFIKHFNWHHIIQAHIDPSSYLATKCHDDRKDYYVLTYK